MQGFRIDRRTDRQTEAEKPWITGKVETTREANEDRLKTYYASNYVSLNTHCFYFGFISILRCFDVETLESKPFVTLEMLDKCL